MLLYSWLEFCLSLREPPPVPSPGRKKKERTQVICTTVLLPRSMQVLSSCVVVHPPLLEKWRVKEGKGKEEKKFSSSKLKKETERRKSGYKERIDGWMWMGDSVSRRHAKCKVDFQLESWLSIFFFFHPNFGQNFILNLLPVEILNFDTEIKMRTG